MTSEQMYEGGEDHANTPTSNAQNLGQAVENDSQAVKSGPQKRSIEEKHRIHVAARADTLIEDNDKVVLAFPTSKFFRSPLGIDANAFANNLDDVGYLSNIRFAIRSWFSCFIQEDVHAHVHGHSIEQATIYFQDTDDFLSSLILAKYREVDYENTQMRKDFEALDAKVSELEALTNSTRTKPDGTNN